MAILDMLLDLLYPPRCVFCHRLIEGGDPVCRACRNSLPVTGALDREQKFPYISRCVSPLFYEKDVRASLLRYKFHYATGYARVYGEFLSKCIDESAVSCDSITWVPLSRRRLRQRGYDQARLLAEELSRRTGLPCQPLLRKRRHNKAQSKTGAAEERRANVADVYEAIHPEQIQGRRLLLVDDIVTTGATLSACGKLLKAAGARQVYAVTVARRRP